MIDSKAARTCLVPLSRRLQAIVDLAGTGGVLCDVGCDHAHVPIRLLQEGKYARAIGMDVIGGPLEKAAGNLRLYGMEDAVELRLSDGLDAFRAGEADTLVITGMGGSMMREILLREPSKTGSFAALVLGPQSDPDKVRSALRALGFAIGEERLLFEDGKYYPVIWASEDPDPADGAADGASFAPDVPQELRQAAEDLFGPVLLRKRDPVLHEYLVRQSRVLEKILASVREAAAKARVEGPERERVASSVRELPEREQARRDGRDPEERLAAGRDTPRKPLPAGLQKARGLARAHLARQAQLERSLRIFRAALTVYGEGEEPQRKEQSQ